MLISEGQAWVPVCSHLVCVLGSSDHPARTCQGGSRKGPEKEYRILFPDPREGILGNLGKVESCREKEPLHD